MNFLKTFFGQLIRKPDIDFQNQGIRQANVQTHIDYTGGNGGIISGLDVFKTSDGFTLIVTPGVFYTKGVLGDSNSVGGGERCEVYDPVYLTGLPVTAPFNGQPKYVLVYAKIINTNTDPSISPAQPALTSKNIQTGEDVPVREYTSVSIDITNPIFLSEVGNINALPLALVQVDYVGTTRVASDGSIQGLDTGVRSEYTIAGVLNIPKKRINSIGIDDDFLISRMFDNDSVLQRHVPDGVIDSIKLAPWDRTSVGTTSGSGVDSGHIKKSAVTYPKINITGSLNNFSETNYVFNSSFDVEKNTAPEADLVGWGVYNSVASIPTYTGVSAGVFRTNLESYNGSYSAVINGADPVVAGGVQSIALYQDIVFPGYDINGKDLMSFFYMKTDADMVPGTDEVSASLQFISSGNIVGGGTFMSYSGSQIGWTKFETSSPIRYQNGTAAQADSVRLLVSAQTTNNVNVYLDNFFVGLTNIEPSWSPSVSDFDYIDTLNKANISSKNLNTTNLSGNQVTATAILSAGSGISNLGSIGSPFKEINVNDFYLGGIPLNFVTNKFEILTVTGSGNQFSWQVPSSTTSIIVEMVGGGGGGASGSDDSSFVFSATEGAKGGAGGSGAEYVRQSIPVTPGEILTITVGAGGNGGGINGAGGIFGDPLTSYLGYSGQSTTIQRGSVVLATAMGGGPGGTSTGVRYSNPGGGTTTLSNGIVSIQGITAPSGNIVGPAVHQTAPASNCGGPGAEFLAGPFLASGGAGGRGYDAGGGHPDSPLSDGQPGSFPGSGGGGGGGSLSGVAGAPPNDSRGGVGGKGGNGIVIIHY